MHTDEAMRFRPEVVVTVLDDSAVLLDLDSKFFYSVNASGWAIVQMLENGAREEDVIEGCRALGAPAEASAAISTFLETLRDYGLTEVTTETETDSDDVDWTGMWTDPQVERHKEPLQRVMVSAFDPSLPLAE